MKVNIIYETTDAPYGGGNQFLKAIRRTMVEMGVYTEEADADIFLFNSHQSVEKVTSLRKKYPNKKFIHRIDGPIRLYNKMDDNRDNIVYYLNANIADATVFQSSWSKKANIRLGMNDDKPSAIINNASDHNIFYDMQLKKGTKTKLIASSFSPNIKKGFHFYKFLDDNLDFEKFDFAFAGNSPVKFKNIKTLGCIPSKELAKEMNYSDICITASENDPCSNTVIEALSCGLPVIALDSGGHKELIGSAGEYYTTKENMIFAIEKVSKNVESYKEKIISRPINEITGQYLRFFENILDAKHRH
tara:strand:+ start:2830 stop:3738 length:909 start_codon:yes stop_codon:yes gene_type:complete